MKIIIQFGHYSQYNSAGDCEITKVTKEFSKDQKIEEIENYICSFKNLLDKSPSFKIRELQQTKVDLFFVE